MTEKKNTQIIFELPANMILGRLGPRKWISILLLAWGTTAACLAAVRNGIQLIIVRLCLGFAEAGLAPAIYLYLSAWYTKAELTKRMAIYFAGGITANVKIIATAFLCKLFQLNFLSCLDHWWHFGKSLFTKLR